MIQERPRLDQLTATRFFAALSVVLYHGGRELDILSLFPILTAGPTAVNYFFVLSGFVITMAYYRPDERFDFRTYFIARFSRIYPVYILSFALTCLYYIDIMSRIKSGKILANIFLYQAWLPRYALSFNIAAWSLSVEVFFYLTFPLIAIGMRRFSSKTVLWISLAFWIASQVIHSLLYIRYMPQETNWLLYFPFFHLNSFLLGLAGGVWYTNRSENHNVNQSLNRVILLVSLGLVLLATTLREYAPPFPKGFSLDAGFLAPVFLLIILALALDTTNLSRRLSHPWLVLLGDSSYALFILHIPFLWLFRRLLEITGVSMSYGTMFSIHVINSVLLSILVFKFVERPARDWLRKNARVLPYFFLDVILVVIAIRLSFSLRLGEEIIHYLRTQTFALRVGVTAFFIFLLVFRFYIKSSSGSLAWAVLSGSVVLTGCLYVAWTAGWVESLPRSVIALIAGMVFTLISLSRFGIRFLRNRQRPTPTISNS
jgi:peptidoglycan/LPS O-acetylase OafA/YrhL